MPSGRPKGVKNKTTQERIRNAEKVPDEQIKEVFDYWVAAMNKRTAALDLDRRRNIGNAIYLYGIKTCKDAIDGCAMSDFHQGRNKQKKKYNDIELILRDTEHIERFISYLRDE